MTGKNYLEHLQAAWDKRKEYLLSSSICAFRLFLRHEVGGLPVAGDVYLGEDLSGKFFLAVVFQVYEDMDEYVINDKLPSLEEEVNLWLEKNWSDLGKLAGDKAEGESIETLYFYKNRFRVKEAPDAGGELAARPVEMVVVEDGKKFLLNLNNYLDVGLFLDHRETRRMMAEEILDMKEKVAEITMLNLFAYTGSFSIYAAAAGAFKTHTVDLSKTYCDWARKNMDLNGFSAEANWIYRMDTFEFYKYAAKKDLKFNVIVIDPPTFSRNKGINFSVQKDHQALIEGAMKMLLPGGMIIFSNNCLEFVMSAEIVDKFKIESINKNTVPKDFLKAFGPQIHNCYLIYKN